MPAVFGSQTDLQRAALRDMVPQHANLDFSGHSSNPGAQPNTLQMFGHRDRIENLRESLNVNVGKRLHKLSHRSLSSRPHGRPIHSIATAVFSKAPLCDRLSGTAFSGRSHALMP